MIVIGAFGGRLDHLLGNIFLLERYPNIMLLGPFNRAKLLVGPTDREIVKRSGFLSLIPISDLAEGVTLKGFKYPLDDVVLRRGTTWGISNEIVSEQAHIFIRQGKVLAIISEEEDNG
jgi:thiamine pyrophosphokinase